MICVAGVRLQLPTAPPTYSIYSSIFPLRRVIAIDFIFLYLRIVNYILG